MSDDTSDIHQGDLMLAEAAKLDLVLARHIHAEALAAGTTDELCKLTRVYTRVTHSMRQSLGLLARQKADRAKAEREARAEGAAADTSRQAAVRERLDQINDAVGRLANAASGGDLARYGRFIHRLDLELEDWHLEEDFLDYDLDVVVRHTARVLGLPRELIHRWRDLPAPSQYADPDFSDEPYQPKPEYMNWPPGAFASDAETSSANDETPDDAPDAAPAVPVQDSA